MIHEHEATQTPATEEQHAPETVVPTDGLALLNDAMAADMANELQKPAEMYLPVKMVDMVDVVEGSLTVADPGTDPSDPSAPAAGAENVTPAASEGSSEDSFDLKGSPRWNNAAHEATAKGLKPNSKEWLDYVREALRKMPDLNKKPKPTHPKKDRKEQAGQPGNPVRQERRDDRPQGQGRKGQGQGQERRERSQGSGSEAFSPAFVNYSAIVSMLLKALRFRRNQYLRSRGEVKSVPEMRDFYTISFGGTRQSGKTKYLFERFCRDWSTSIFVVPEAAHAEALKQFAPEGMKESQLNELMKRVVTAQQVLADINKYTGPIAADAKPKLTIEVDPNDANPAATLSSYVAAYMEEQRAFREHEAPATHPALLPLKTVYVDDMSNCESRNLTFARLVRYVRLGGQTPEIIISQH